MRPGKRLRRRFPPAPPYRWRGTSGGRYAAQPSRRSRVTPGVGATSAARRPTSRLKRVDLPTLGRPTMATVKATGGPQRESDQVRGVGQDEEGPIGDHGRQADGASCVVGAQIAAVVGRDREHAAVGARDDQPIVDQNRTGPEQPILPVLRVRVAGQRSDPEKSCRAPGSCRRARRRTSSRTRSCRRPRACRDRQCHAPQTRRPLRASMATMRPPWPMAKTVPRSETGCPSMSLKVEMAPIRAP